LSASHLGKLTDFVKKITLSPKTEISNLVLGTRFVL